MDANGFPLTIMVYVSSFSVDIKLPNQDRFVNSGEGSGVGFSDISSTMINQTIFIVKYFVHWCFIILIYMHLYFCWYIPCNFLLWNLGDPKKLFLMLFNLLLQWAEDGEPGGVGNSWSVSFPPEKWLWCRYEIIFNKLIVKCHRKYFGWINFLTSSSLCRMVTWWHMSIMLRRSHKYVFMSRGYQGTSSFSRWVMNGGCTPAVSTTNRMSTSKFRGWNWRLGHLSYAIWVVIAWSWIMNSCSRNRVRATANCWRTTNRRSSTELTSSVCWRTPNNSR